MTPHELAKISAKFPLSKSTIERNRDALAGWVCSQVAKPVRGREGEDSRVETGESGIRYRITLCCFRKHPLDSHDNARTALKAICDRITQALGFGSDSTASTEWHYHQVRCERDEGTSVRIERL